MPTTPTTTRLPDELLEELRVRASASGRTQTGIIVIALRRELDRLARIDARIAEIEADRSQS